VCVCVCVQRVLGCHLALPPDIVWATQRWRLKCGVELGLALGPVS